MEDDNNAWINRFNFIQPLGGGGMGEVYLAEDYENKNQPCVVKKIINEGKDLCSQIEMIKVCQREADLLRKLNHRGIVKLLDDHYSAEGLYVVMEYIPGSNLEEVVNSEGALDSETVLRIGIQCCDVLDYLHNFEPPIVYRDLKPSNLMLRTDGLVVFIDFGIARDFGPKDGPATRVVTSGYSPPEQYFGKPDLRGDLYSLGATMHHLLTGVRPKPLTPCNPLHLNPSVLPDLDALIRRLTANEKEERPPSALAVQHELFKIYKQVHPDFEIPDLGVEENIEPENARNMDGTELSPAPGTRGGRTNDHGRAGRNMTNRSGSSAENSGDTESGGNQPIVERLRQWFSNFTGKRSD